MENALTESSEYIVQPGGALTGTVRVPGDKSMSHRSIIMGSLAVGETRVSGFLEGEDSLRTLQAFRDMGVAIEHQPGAMVRIQGVGLHGLKAPAKALDLGNSGTGMRLLAGVMAGQEFTSSLVGDESLHARPMGRVIKPLQQMGADISGNPEDKPPLVITGKGSAQQLKAINYTTPVASAQIKSCLLFAGLYADGVTEIIEPGITRDHTERMLRGFGVNIDSDNNTVSLKGGQQLQATDIEVPADISSAAFFLVGASIAQGSDILLQHVGINPTRTGIIDILRLMGADITLQQERLVGGEPVADIRVKYAGLKGIDVPRELVPLAIDEFPALFIAACCATGATTVSGAEELRVKETDRIAAMVSGLKQMGAQIEETPDGAVIQGDQQLAGATVESFGDHRIAMSFAMASMVTSHEVRILDCANVNTSFPNFVQTAASAGLGIRVSDEVAL